jgi:hypothetical protein
VDLTIGYRGGLHAGETVILSSTSLQSCPVTQGSASRCRRPRQPIRISLINGFLDRIVEVSLIEANRELVLRPRGWRAYAIDILPPVGGLGKRAGTDEGDLAAVDDLRQSVGGIDHQVGRRGCCGVLG